MDEEEGLEKRGRMKRKDDEGRCRRTWNVGEIGGRMKRKD